MQDRPQTWVLGELLVVLDALVLAIAGIAWSQEPQENWGDLGPYVIATSLPLFGLAWLAVRYSRAAGWILIGIGAPLLLAILALRANMGDPANPMDLVLFAIFAAPPLGGALLLKRPGRPS